MKSSDGSPIVVDLNEHMTSEIESIMFNFQYKGPDPFTFAAEMILQLDSIFELFGFFTTLKI